MGAFARSRGSSAVPQKGAFMSRLFGTDGVRGLANVDITAELALNGDGGRARPGA